MNKTQRYVIIHISVPVVTSTNSVTDSLYSHLFTNYKEKLIPVCTPGGKVDVFFGTALRQMMNLVLHLFLLNIFMKFDRFNFSQKKKARNECYLIFTLLKLWNLVNSRFHFTFLFFYFFLNRMRRIKHWRSTFGWGW